MVEAVVVETFNLAPDQVTTTTLAQQRAVLLAAQLAVLVPQALFRRVVVLAALAQATRKAMTRRLTVLISESVFYLFIIKKF